MAKLEYTISAVWNDKVLEILKSHTERIEKLEAENKALIELIKPDALKDIKNPPLRDTNTYIENGVKKDN